MPFSPFRLTSKSPELRTNGFSIDVNRAQSDGYSILAIQLRNGTEYGDQASPCFG